MVRISHDSPRKVTTLLRLHQWAANEDGSHNLNVAGEKAVGEDWGKSWVMGWVVAMGVAVE